ncbi:MAG: methyltransferase domain-containing protein [Asgard group archaeon]|nr:methyltransferase domain-containing protein [Asgard group archaeon]
MDEKKKIVKEKYAEALTKAEKEKNTVRTEGSVIHSSRPEQGLFSQEIMAPSFGCIYNLPAQANITKGMTVIDFGSGTGYDLIKAVRLTGPTGKVIGVDMTKEMVEKAKKNMEKMGYENVEIIYAEIEDIPLPEKIADVIISNCVINLAPDKLAVFKEVFRLLKSGGRLVDGDKIAKEPLPKSLQENTDAWCGCVSGALTEEGYKKTLQKAGFTDIQISLDKEDSFQWEGEEIMIYSGILRATKP